MIDIPLISLNWGIPFLFKSSCLLSNAKKIGVKIVPTITIPETIRMNDLWVSALILFSKSL